MSFGRRAAVTAGLLLLLAVSAYRYFGQPDIPRAKLEARYANPPSQFIVLPGGARVHFRDRGPRGAEALILLHGSNDSLFTWEPWAMRLRDKFRIVTADLPGHGLTGAVPHPDYSEEGMARFVGEFADALGIRSFTIGGNSMGGRIAARFAEEYPDRVSHLILVDSGGFAASRSPVLSLVFRLASVGMIARPLLHIAPRWIVVQGVHRAVVRIDQVPEQRIQGLWDLNHLEGTRDATIARFRNDGSSVQDHVHEIGVPTLILWGKEDKAVSVAAAYEFHAAIRNSKLVIYPGTGHLPQEEAADSSAADVRSFLAGR